MLLGKHEARLVTALTLLFFSCSSPDPGESVREPANPDDLMLHHLLIDLKLQTGEQHYKTGYNILSGKHYFDSEKIQLALEKRDDKILTSVIIQLDDSTHFPTVYNSDFDMDENADNLEFMMIGSAGGKQLFKFNAQQSASSAKYLEFSFQIMPNQLKSLEQGNHIITLSMSTEWVSFFGVKSGIKPVSALVEFSYMVPAIFKSSIYFKYLKLDELATDTELNDGHFGNDYKNPSPEIYFKIYYNDYFVGDLEQKNSYEIDQPKKFDFYRTANDAQFEFVIQDMDYFLNANDYLTDTLINYNDLQGDTYQKISFYCVEELWIYCETGSVVNSPDTR